jgi:hypothetical protein
MMTINDDDDDDDDDELESIWKEALITYFTELTWHLPGQTKENHEKPQ